MLCFNYPKTLTFLVSLLVLATFLVERFSIRFQISTYCQHFLYDTFGLYPFERFTSLSCSDEKTKIKQEPLAIHKINLRSPDDSIRASFIPFGASLTELWVKDRTNVWRDVVLGYDDLTKYKTDVDSHLYFGSIVGRYANRIKKGTFQIDGKTFYTPLNENNQTTLHGGEMGYDRRVFKIEKVNESSVSLTLYDHDGYQGFPASVAVRVQYCLGNEARMKMVMDANVTDEKKTPIMLSSHIYWALHGFVNDGQNTIFNQTLHLPSANRFIKVDKDLVPTGDILKVKNTPLDFEEPRKFSEHFERTQDLCGKGCKGWDTCFVLDDHKKQEPVVSVSSPETGINMQIQTNQNAIQIYTCNAISTSNHKIPRKRIHGGGGGDGKDQTIYENYSCLVIELEDLIDGINNPQWNQNQLYSNKRPFHWESEFSFSTF